jgi:hypothetical protein
MRAAGLQLLLRVLALMRWGPVRLLLLIVIKKAAARGLSKRFACKFPQPAHLLRPSVPPETRHPAGEARGLAGKTRAAHARLTAEAWLRR